METLSKVKNLNSKKLVFASKTPKFPPKVAYTLLEIAQKVNPIKDTIYDPFCGNGTILIMAGLNFKDQLKHFYGSDINQEAVESTQLNLATYSALSDEEILSQIMPLDCTNQFPHNLDGTKTVIVTDPPFGRRCKLLPGTLERAFNSFQRNRVTDLSFCFDDKTILPEGLSEHYRIKEVYNNWNRAFYIAKIK